MAHPVGNGIRPGKLAIPAVAMSLLAIRAPDFDGDPRRRATRPRRFQGELAHQERLTRGKRTTCLHRGWSKTVRIERPAIGSETRGPGWPGTIAAGGGA